MRRKVDDPIVFDQPDFPAVESTDFYTDVPLSRTLIQIVAETRCETADQFKVRDAVGEDGREPETLRRH